MLRRTLPDAGAFLTLPATLAAATRFDIARLLRVLIDAARVRPPNVARSSHVRTSPQSIPGNQAIRLQLAAGTTGRTACYERHSSLRLVRECPCISAAPRAFFPIPLSLRVMRSIAVEPALISDLSNASYLPEVTLGRWPRCSPIW